MNDLPHELARTLADRAGLGTPKSLEPLAGGRNNRVFRVDFKGGEAAVLKSYYHDPRDPRDRLRAEWSFLNYVTARDVRNVPRPLAIDVAAHSALYSFVIGGRPKNVDGDLIRQAAEFAVAINRAPNEADSLSPRPKPASRSPVISRLSIVALPACASLTRTFRTSRLPEHLSRAGLKRCGIA